MENQPTASAFTITNGRVVGLPTAYINRLLAGMEGYYQFLSVEVAQIHEREYGINLHTQKALAGDPWCCLQLLHVEDELPNKEVWVVMTETHLTEVTREVALTQGGLFHREATTVTRRFPLVIPIGEHREWLSKHLTGNIDEDAVLPEAYLTDDRFLLMDDYITDVNLSYRTLLDEPHEYHLFLDADLSTEALDEEFLDIEAMLIKLTPHP